MASTYNLYRSEWDGLAARRLLRIHAADTVVREALASGGACDFYAFTAAIFGGIPLVGTDATVGTPLRMTLEDRETLALALNYTRMTGTLYQRAEDKQRIGIALPNPHRSNLEGTDSPVAFSLGQKDEGLVVGSICLRACEYDPSLELVDPPKDIKIATFFRRLGSTGVTYSGLEPLIFDQRQIFDAIPRTQIANVEMRVGQLQRAASFAMQNA